MNVSTPWCHAISSGHSLILEPPWPIGCACSGRAAGWCSSTATGCIVARIERGEQGRPHIIIEGVSPSHRDAAGLRNRSVRS